MLETPAISSRTPANYDQRPEEAGAAVCPVRHKSAVAPPLTFTAPALSPSSLPPLRIVSAGPPDDAKSRDRQITVATLVGRENPFERFANNIVASVLLL